MPGCRVSCTAAPVKGNLSSAQGPDQATWLAAWFLCCCHNGIITPQDKSLAVEERTLKPDATNWIMLSLNLLPAFLHSFPSAATYVSHSALHTSHAVIITRQ